MTHQNEERHPAGNQVATQSLIEDTDILSRARRHDYAVVVLIGRDLVGISNQGHPLEEVGKVSFWVSCFEFGCHRMQLREVLNAGGVLGIIGGTQLLEVPGPVEHRVDARVVVVVAGDHDDAVAQVELLERRLERLVQVYADEYGVDVSELPGSGAAGGLAGGLAAVGATLVPGFELISDAVDLDEQVEEADLVITGEGFLDEESFDGKVVGGVVELGRELGTPVVAVVGESFDGAAGKVPTVSLVERFGRERALGHTLACLQEAAADAIALVR